MDAASLAVLVTACSGAVLGAAGLWQARHRDTTAARSMATEVATHAAETAVAALNAALDRQQEEIEHLSARVEDLQIEVTRCEVEKADLRREVRELVNALETGRG